MRVRWEGVAVDLKGCLVADDDGVKRSRRSRIRGVSR